jgi:hypothetical protein
MGWIRSNWKAIAATAVAFMIGAVAGASGANQQQEIDRKDSKIASLRADVRAAQMRIEDRGKTIAELGTYRKDALKYRAHRDRIKREEAAAQEAAQQRQAEQEKAEREQREAAERAAQGTIDGDGTWQVGADFAAGTYRASAGGTCYWARLRTPHGSDSIDDIIDNGVGGGSQTVQLNEGEWFETNGCGEWQKIG